MPNNNWFTNPAKKFEDTRKAVKRDHVDTIVDGIIAIVKAVVDDVINKQNKPPIVYSKPGQK